MCDYSLAQVSNRLAVNGDHLVVHRFPTGTIGLRFYRRRLRELLFPPTVTAVCIPPGARLLLQNVPTRLQQTLGVTSTEEVTFIQRGLEANTHRDGVRFANGHEVLLQELEAGQGATVLSLDCEQMPVRSISSTSLTKTAESLVMSQR